ncbi:MAG: xylulokinase [Armatimonadota bacterium]|nr:MAG: xylulokinase [Armatimonadota bacterium]
MAELLIGVDVGTTGTKAVLVDPSGRVAARATHEYPLHTPRPGWAEQDPHDWWRATVAAIRDVLAAAGASPEEVHGLGLSGQQHGSVFLDKDGKVLREALLWCDQRTAAQCDSIHQTVGFDKVVEETLNPVLTGFQAPKIVWLSDNEPEVYERLRMILLPKDYVRYRLTGEFATEVSDAAGTSLLNVGKRQWSEVMVRGLGLTMDMLPEVYESPEASAAICETAARETGLRVGMPIAGGGGDNACSAVGNGVIEEGTVQVSVGTSGTVFAPMLEPKMDPKLRVHTFCHAVPGQWHAMGVMLMAGGSLRWFRDELCAEEKAEAERRGADPYEIITAKAAAASIGSEGLIFLPYLTGERTPHADPNARGVFMGIGLRHTKAHMARAIMEGVCYGLRDSLEILREMDLPIEEVRNTGGGSRSKFWRQMQSDVFRTPLVAMEIDEGAAFGAALLGGVAGGVWPDVPAACAATVRTEEPVKPNRKASAIYNKYYPTYRGLYRSLNRHFARVAGVVGKLT